MILSNRDISDPSHVGKKMNTFRHTEPSENTGISHNMFIGSAFFGTISVDKPHECRVSTQYG